MDFLTDWLTDWLKELLISGIMGNLEGLFDTVNAKVGKLADKGENPGVPCRRSFPHFCRYLPDLRVDLVKHPAEIA